MINELTFPLIGLKYGTRTNIKKGIINNKDAALLILAANGGTMKVNDIKVLLRGWRPLGDGSSKNHARFYPNRELDFMYLFNTYYGHIDLAFNTKRILPNKRMRFGRMQECGMRHYTVGAYMWRPKRGSAAISSLGYDRLRLLVDKFRRAGMDLDSQIIEAGSKTA